MKLIDAIELVSTVRPKWKDGGSTYKAPHCFNREHALRLLGANKNVKTIKKRDLAAMRGKLQQEYGKRGKRTPGGINRIMSFIHTVLAELVELEVLEAAPRLRPLPENNLKEQYYSKEQVYKMIDCAVTVYDRPALGEAMLFAAFTGCRQDELLSLSVGDVNLTRAQVTFRDTKNGTNHTVDINREIFTIIEKRCEGRSSDAKVFDDWRNDDQLRNEFYKVRDYVGIDEEHNWHTFRHTTGTWLAEKGVPIQTIAKILNHKQVMTSERYIKVTDKARKAAIDAL